MAVLKIMDWEARVWVFLEKMVWTTIIERGGVSCRYLGLLSDDPSCSFFFLQYCNYFEYDFQT